MTRTIHCLAVLACSVAPCDRPRPVLEVRRRQPALPLEVGRRRQRGSANHMKPETVLGGAADPDRRGHRARAGAERRHAVLRHPPVRHAHQAHDHEPGSNRRGSNEEIVVAEIGQVGTQFDGFAHQTHRRQPLQLLQAGRHRDAQRLHEARHRKGRRAHDARRADRRRGAQGRRDAARHLRDHGAAICSRRCSGRSSRCSRATPSSSTPAGAGCGGRTTRAT